MNFIRTWIPDPELKKCLAHLLQDRLVMNESLDTLLHQIRINESALDADGYGVSLPYVPCWTYEGFLRSKNPNCWNRLVQYVLMYDPTFLPIDTKLPNQKGTFYDLFCQVVRARGEDCCSEVYRCMLHVYTRNQLQRLVLDKFVLTMVYLRREYEALSAATANVPDIVSQMTTLTISPVITQLHLPEPEYDLAKGLHDMAISISVPVTEDSIFEKDAEMVSNFEDWTMVEGQE